MADKALTCQLCGEVHCIAEKQWRIMHDPFHATKSTGSITFVYLLVMGQNPFDDMWEFDPNIGFDVFKTLHSCCFGVSLVRKIVDWYHYFFGNIRCFN